MNTEIGSETQARNQKHTNKDFKNFFHKTTASMKKLEMPKKT
jgi:hypothetical protein